MAEEDNSAEIIAEKQQQCTEPDGEVIRHTIQEHFKFSLKLLRNVTSKKESSIVSPISVAISLSMVYGGATGETAKQIEQLLPNSNHKEELHEHFGKLFQTIQKADERKNRNTSANRTLEIVNKVYMQNSGDFKVLGSFTALLNKHYGDGHSIFELIDFAEKDTSLERINSSVAEITHDKITNFINASMLEGEICLMLINACYFKGCWKSKFKPEETKKKIFLHELAKAKKEEILTIDMMRKETTFLYAESIKFKLLGIQYVGNDVQILFLLPKARCGLNRFLARKNGEKIMMKLLKKAKNRLVKVELPKFKLESRLDLVEPLKRLGIVKAFNKGEAELNGIATSAGQSLWIGHCLQQALIEVNEEGTEAAATTEVVVLREYNMCFPSGGRSYVPKTWKFIADHPFAFFLMYTNEQQKQQQQCVLFSGTFYG